MLNRLIVTIDGLEYTVVAEEPEDYIRKNAALVDQSLRDIKASTSLSSLNAAVLAAMNIADRYYKAQAAADDLRSQVKEYAEECSKLRSELARHRKN